MEVQFVRRLLGIGSRAIVASLFTETGFMPIGHRRLILALRYLQYLLRLPPHQYAAAAMRDTFALAGSSQACWATDIRLVLRRLCVGLEGAWHALQDFKSVDDIIAAVEGAAGKEQQDELDRSHRLVLLQGRVNPDLIAEPGFSPLKYRAYLDVHIPAHRKALTRLMVAQHPLAVELLRRRERYRAYVPKPMRICRFCRVHVEDEVHVLLLCTGDAALTDVRQEFSTGISHVIPRLPSMDGIAFIQAVVDGPMEGVAIFARFVHRVFARVDAVPMIIPASARINAVRVGISQR